MKGYYYIVQRDFAKKKLKLKKLLYCEDMFPSQSSVPCQNKYGYMTFLKDKTLSSMKVVINQIERKPVW